MILAKIGGGTRFIVYIPLSLYFFCPIIGCQFVTSEETRYRKHWNEHLTKFKEDMGLNEIFLIYWINKKLNPSVNVCCGNLLRSRKEESTGA
jgi:hypothetical protein